MTDTRLLKGREVKGSEGKGSEGKEHASKPRARKTRLPNDFGISQRVQQWAADKGHDRLKEHLEYFVGYVRANGKTYEDWDDALMNAIRGNWAKLQNNNGATGPTRKGVAAI